MHVFLRKSPLCRSHFFEWLKTAISSNACGTSTLKSPLLRAFFTPHVHQRLRKRPPRCTSDCGPLSCYIFERPSPPEKPSCKVRFFANRHFRKYRQKVTVTMLFQTAFHRIFQLLAQTAHVCFHRRKRVTHSAFGERSHTAAHRAKQGAFPPPATMWSCAASEIAPITAFVTLISPRFYIHTFPGSL